MRGFIWRRDTTGLPRQTRRYEDVALQNHGGRRGKNRRCGGTGVSHGLGYSFGLGFLEAQARGGKNWKKPGIGVYTFSNVGELSSETP